MLQIPGIAFDAWAYVMQKTGASSIVRISLCVALFIYGDMSHAKSLSETVESILAARRDYEEKSLRFELDNLPIDREDFPALDEKSGAINIPGETPRDKAVTDFLKSLSSYDRSVAEAARREHRLQESLLDDREPTVPVRIVIKSKSGPDTWIPLKIQVKVNDGRPMELGYLPGLDVPADFEILRTALLQGRHSLRVTGVAARLPEAKNVRLNLLQDAQPFDQKIDLIIESRDAHSDAIAFAFNSTQSGLKLESDFDESSQK